MIELRKDWLTGRTVLFAAHRADRPNEFAAEPATAAAGMKSGSPCPFCPGQESMTPPAVYSQVDDAGHWKLRVVPNKFPAVSIDEPIVTGAHEVVIESARHACRMGELSVAEIAEVLAAYRARLAHWRASGRFEYGLVFKNLGAPAGASLAHVHSQLIALPEVPAMMAEEFARARQSLREKGVCAYCQLIEQEREAKERVVFDRDGFIAFCPYASLQPCEVWIMPTAHEAWFEARQLENDTDPLAEILQTLLVRIEEILPRAAYNVLVRTSPWQDDAGDAGHWRIEILPRVNSLAGFELATQTYINPIDPTRAAQRLLIAERETCR